MPEQRFQIETIRRIHDTRNSADYLEVGWSADGDIGELLEIRSVTHRSGNSPEITQRIVIEPEGIDSLIQVLESFKPR